MDRAFSDLVKSRGFRNLSHLADDLLEQNPTLFKRSPSSFKAQQGAADENKAQSPQKSQQLPRETLLNYLSNLDRNKNRWWINRPEADCLAAMLGMDKRALGLEAQGKGFTFDAFPALAPLDLSHEAPWALGKPVQAAPLESTLHIRDEPYRATWRPGAVTLDAWFSDLPAHIHGKDIHWLYVPDGLELELLIARFAAGEQLAFAAWDDMARKLETDFWQVRRKAPLVIGLRNPATSEQVTYLLKARENEPLLIVSRYPHPGESVQGKSVAVHTWQWTMVSGWKERLITWVQNRLAATRSGNKLNVSSMMRVLTVLDPGGNVFTETSDILQLCYLAYLHRWDETDAKKHLTALEDDNSLLPEWFGRRTKEPGRTSYPLDKRWRATEIPWEGPLPLEVWAHLAGDEKVLQAWTSTVLCNIGGGRFDLKQPALARRTFVLNELSDMVYDVQGWPDWIDACFDPPRRSDFDRVLDRRSLDELRHLAAHFHPQKGKSNPLNAVQQVAVDEALFLAVGRKLARSPEDMNRIAVNIEHNQVWSDLAKRVAERVKSDIGGPWPLTIAMPSNKEIMAWIAAYWAWCLAFGLDRKIRESPDWLCGNIQRHEIQLVDEPSEAWKALLSVAEQWIVKERVPLNESGKHLPLLFNVAMICADPVSGAARLGASWWIGVIGRPWTEKALHDRLKGMNKDECTQFVRRWWPAVVEHQVRYFNDRSNGYRPLYSDWNATGDKSSDLLGDIAALVAENSDDVLEHIPNDHRIMLAQRAGSLPPPIRARLLEWFAQSDTSFTLIQKALDMRDIARFFDVLAHDMCAKIEPFLPIKACARQIAELLWRYQPARAVELFQSTPREGQIALEALVLTCPTDCLAVAVDAMQNSADLLDTQQRIAWLVHNLPYARNSAPTMHRLLIKARQSDRRALAAKDG